MGTAVLTTESETLQCSKSPVPDGTVKSGTTEFLRAIVWRNVIILLYVHLAAICGVYVAIFKAKALTIIWSEYLQLSTIKLQFQVHRTINYIH
jgi:hypothetical protein